MIRATNNLDAMRLLAALAVIVGHSFTLTGVAAAPRVLGIPIHSLGLYAFFAISGYLISTSWHRNPNLVAYLTNRCLRIFPALILVVLATTFLIGPAVSVLSSIDYFRSDLVYKYLLNIFLTAQYQLPGVFETGHRSTAVNGVLWTLGLEFICYLTIAAIGILLRGRRLWGYAAFAIIAVGFALVPGGVPATSWMGPAGTTWAFFAVGALLSAAPKGCFTRKSLVVVIPIWIVITALFPAAATFVAWFALPFTVLALGLSSTPGIRSLGRFGDLSYGMYLWGFLVQQLVIEWFNPLPWFANTSLVIVVTGAIAFASWHLVEKRALAHKIKVPSPEKRTRAKPSPSPVGP